MSAKRFPGDLLEQAQFLTAKDPNRPKQASLRRGVSTAYYALFHLLCAEGVELLAPNVSAATRHTIQRWFEHDRMRQTAGFFLRTPSPKVLTDILGAGPSPDLQQVARNFISLQQARHSADYDMNWNVTRVTAQAFVQEAQEAMAAWRRIRRSEEATVFMLWMFHWKQLESPRP